MSDVHGQVDDVRRRIALEMAPLTRELEAAEQAAPTPARRSYWRSLADLAKTPSFLQWAHDEFPQLRQELAATAEGPSRRRFLQLMGASIALAGLGAAGCRRPEGKILPYNKKPVDVTIGKGMYYASTFVLGGKPLGVLAQTHTGRPTKIEGNPLHPNSRGGTDLFAQASILDLYDPDRSRQYRNGKNHATREQFVAFVDELAKELRASQGDGLAILLRHVNSPAVEMMLSQMQQSLPKARVYAYEPLKMDPSRPEPAYGLGGARVIISLDADILGIEDSGVAYRRQFAEGRRVDTAAAMNQLYVVEPVFTPTGAVADHRLALKASEVQRFAVSLLGALTEKFAISGWEGKPKQWLEALVETVRSNKGHVLVVAGARQPVEVHVAAYEINNRFGNGGEGLLGYSDIHGISELAQGIGRGAVKTLVIVEGNPAYDAPADLRFAEALKAIPASIRLGLYDDETSEVCQWHVPAAHYLESWGDVRDVRGRYMSPVQPMIEPMFSEMTGIELLARLTCFVKSDPYEIVRMSFDRAVGKKGGDQAFAKYLQEGVVEIADQRFEHFKNADYYAGMSVGAPEPQSGIEVCFAADPSVYDGRFANNAWLQECPDPITKLTWDNAAIISPGTARSLSVQTGDVIRIEASGASVDAPVFVLPGTVDDSITLPLGYGRTRGGVICKDAGFNAYVLRTTTTMGFATGAKVTRIGKTYPLATTQEHWAIDLDKHFQNTADEQAAERALIREGTFEQYRKHPAFAQKMGEHAPIKLNIYTSPPLSGANQWAMIVDLNACVGCNACVVACQAENNVPVVGKNEVIRGREMQWLRLDRYFAGENNDDVRATLQPMMCQHCENAPCEPVCPVNATVHSPEGLNEMAYNRCIGTRYCSNNCPYKVRRFNYYDWNKGTIRQVTAETRDGREQPDPMKSFGRPQVFQPPMQEMLKMGANPNVTVRMRGVMEKCTFCVQRIETAKIAARSQVAQGAANAEVGGRPAVRVPDDTVVSACAQACPTQAIIFGDISDSNSAFAKRWQEKTSPRSYQVLEHLNVRPRTHYQAKIRNVNPKLAEQPK